MSSDFSARSGVLEVGFHCFGILGLGLKGLGSRAQFAGFRVFRRVSGLSGWLGFRASSLKVLRPGFACLLLVGIQECCCGYGRVSHGDVEGMDASHKRLNVEDWIMLGSLLCAAFPLNH